ncbi:hypothetical protein AVEN_82199-1 [Araneus ventricosus]|uniref:Uncharacterized protein n=1 Tax=Araneus ventricosus TaxID=182803 RepID=A0A4Y2JLN1_ARAVE|nr:hypothetical protein AVEN_82199-1 [Araneus ventricosus]
MLHVAFQNIKVCLISAFVGGFSSTHSTQSEYQLLLLGLAHKQVGKFPSLLVWQLPECPRQWPSILHTLSFAYLQEVQRQSPTITSLPAKWTTFKERSRKINPEILGMCGGSGPHMFPYKSSEKFYQCQ